MVKKPFLTALAALLFAGASNAATVTYTLDLTTPGQFTVYADDSADDNFGIAFWAFQLKATGGQILSEDNLSPFGSRTNALPLGFSDARFPIVNNSTDSNGIPLTPDDSTPSTKYPFSGSQSVLTGQPANFIYGFGQTASSFAVLYGVDYSPTISSLNDGSADQAWNAHLRLASGTYTGTLNFDKDPTALYIAKVWKSNNRIRMDDRDATLRLVVLVPEPATLSLLSLALIGCAGLVRRRSAKRNA